MKETNDILDKVARRSGMTVPEGYFDDFVAKMSQTIAETPREQAQPEPKRTFWHRVRPYAYMAAMFAGIWCMMKMFGMLSGPGPDLTDINNYPGVVTALSDASFVNDYIYPSVDHYDILEDIYLESPAGVEIDPIDDAMFDMPLTDDSI